MTRTATETFTCDSCGRVEEREPPNSLRDNPCPEGWLQIVSYDGRGMTWEAVHLCKTCRDEFSLQEAVKT